ncbi:MAG: SDR family oxidoreductase [Eubacterium sp.]|nr:SDR family oxidoreductase [Eubacterium sp.]
MRLEGKAAIITGASRGLGYKITERFLKEGASLVVCARNMPELEKSIAVFQAKKEYSGRVIPMQADVAKEEDAAALCSTCIQQFGKIDILVNNAGIHGAKGAIDSVDMDEWKRAVEVNLYGTVHMIRHAVVHMKKQKYGKIINLSGGGAASPRPYFSAYAASKAAVVRLTENFAQEYKEDGIDINAVAPGAMNTQLLTDILSMDEAAIGEEYRKAREQLKTGGTDMQVPVGLCAYLASSESDGITGRLVSAVWDSWMGLHTHLKQLQNSDIYTLRRILPTDRGFAWDEE